MGQLSKADLRGFLIPYKLDKSNIWNAESTFSQDDFFSSTPKPSLPSKMTITATGTPSSTADYQIITRRAGINRSAKFSIRNNTDSNTIEYGNDAPTAITYIEMLAYKTGVATGDIGLYPNTISFEDGTLLTACQFTHLPAGINRSVYVFRRTDTGTVSNVSVFSYSTAELTLVTQPTFPAMCKLDDGSVLLVFPFEDGEQVTFQIFRSTDRGLTFTLVNDNCVDFYIPVGSGASDYLLKGVKIASCNGQVLLLVETFFNTASGAQNRLFQFVSIDGGGNFTLVTESDKLDDSSFASVNLMVRDNRFVVSYVGKTDELHFLTLPHGFFQIQDLRAAGKYAIARSGVANSFGTGSDTAIENAGICAWLDDSNDIWLLYHDLINDQIGFIYSSNGVDFFSTAGFSIFFKMETRTGLTHTFLKNFNAVAYLGGSVLATNWSTNTAITGDSLALLFMGNYSTNPSMNFKNRFLTDTVYNRKTFDFTYLPIETPPNCNSLTVSGTGVEDLLTAACLNINVTFPQSDRKYLFTSDPVSTEGGYLRTIFYDVATGSGGSAAQTFLEITHTNVTKQKSGIKILARSSQFIIFDSVSGAVLATISQNSLTGTEIVIAVKNNTASVWFRDMGNDNLRKYTSALNTTTLATVAAATALILTAEFGIEGSPSSGTARAKFKSFLVGSGASVGTNIIAQTQEELSFRPFPDVGNRIYIDDKIKIGVANGVTYHGENWQLLPESNFPIDNVFHSVSPTPRNFWKSLTVSSGTKSEERIAFQLAPGSSNITEIGNDLIGMYLGNINFRLFKFQYHNGGSWVDLASVDTSEGLHHGYKLRGLSLIQDRTNVIDRNYYFYNELVDFVAECTVGSTVTFHRIKSNTEGVFGDSTAKLCTILLEDAPSGDGTVRIIPKNVTVVVSLNSLQASAWAILIQTQETIDKNFKIGHFTLGSCAITGTQYSQGRKILIESGTITTEQPDRIAYRRVVAPNRRSVDIAWSDGVDISAFYDDNPDPDFYKSSVSGSALAVSNYQDAPYLMEGLLTYLQGNQFPMVYLPAISTSLDVRVFNRHSEHILGTIEGEISIESVTGDELRGNGSGEIMRIGTITIQEVV